MELTVRDCLDLSPLNRFKLLTGEAGLDNIVRHATIIDAPDSVYWLKGNEFIMTTAYVFKENKQQLFELASIMASREVAALAIKVNRFLYSIPDGLVKHFEELGIPLLIMPDDCAYRDITAPVYKELWSRDYLDTRQELYSAYYDKVASQVDVTELTDFLASRVHLPLLLFDKTDHLVYVSKGAACPIIQPGSHFEVIKNTMSELFVVKYELSDRGSLAVLQPTAKIQSDIERMIRDSLVVLTMQWIYDDHKKQVSESEFIYSLLTQELNDEKDVFKNMVQFNLDYAQKYLCMVVSLDDMQKGYGEDTSLLEYSKLLPAHKSLGNILSQLFKQQGFQAKVIQDTREMIVLLPCSQKTVSRKESGKTIELIREVCNNQLINYSISIGISARGLELSQIHRSYQQALKALRIGSKVLGQSSVMYYDDLGIYHLLTDNSDRYELEQLYRNTVGKLVDYDRENHTDFYRTFEIYCKNNFNLKETAQELQLHYNSLQYRLKKIMDITTLNVNSSEDIFNLMIGLKVKKLLKT